MAFSLCHYISGNSKLFLCFSLFLTQKFLTLFQFVFRSFYNESRESIYGMELGQKSGDQAGVFGWEQGPLNQILKSFHQFGEAPFPCDFHPFRKRKGRRTAEMIRLSLGSDVDRSHSPKDWIAAYCTMLWDSCHWSEEDEHRGVGAAAVRYKYCWDYCRFITANIRWVFLLWRENNLDRVRDWSGVGCELKGWDLLEIKMGCGKNGWRGAGML